MRINEGVHLSGGIVLHCQIFVGCITNKKQNIFRKAFLIFYWSLIVMKWGCGRKLSYTWFNANKNDSYRCSNIHLIFNLYYLIQAIKKKFCFIFRVSILISDINLEFKYSLPTNLTVMIYYIRYQSLHVSTMRIKDSEDQSLCIGIGGKCWLDISGDKLLGRVWSPTMGADKPLG